MKVYLVGAKNPETKRQVDAQRQANPDFVVPDFVVKGFIDNDITKRVAPSSGIRTSVASMMYLIYWSATATRSSSISSPAPQLPGMRRRARWLASVANSPLWSIPPST